MHRLYPFPLRVIRDHIFWIIIICSYISIFLITFNLFLSSGSGGLFSSPEVPLSCVQAHVETLQKMQGTDLTFDLHLSIYCLENKGDNCHELDKGFINVPS